jgi:hypothetical protein
MPEAIADSSSSLCRATLDGERIAADYRDGVLTLHVPVAEQPKPRKIEISSDGEAQTIQAQPDAGAELRATARSTPKAPPTAAG